MAVPESRSLRPIEVNHEQKNHGLHACDLADRFKHPQFLKDQRFRKMLDYFALLVDEEKQLACDIANQVG